MINVMWNPEAIYQGNGDARYIFHSYGQSAKNLEIHLDARDTGNSQLDHQNL